MRGTLWPRPACRSTSWLWVVLAVVACFCSAPRAAQASSSTGANAICAPPPATPAITFGALSEPPLCRVCFDIRDSLDRPLLARVSVLGADRRSYPGAPDSTLLNYSPSGGYFYPRSTDSLTVPIGYIQVMGGRGFEWQASIEAKLLAPTRFIAAGQTIEVNGQSFTGPLYPPVA